MNWREIPAAVPPAAPSASRRIGERGSATSMCRWQRPPHGGSDNRSVLGQRTTTEDGRPVDSCYPSCMRNSQARCQLHR